MRRLFPSRFSEKATNIWKKSPTCFHVIFVAYSQYLNFTRKYTHTRKTPFFVPIATSLNSGSQAMAEGLCGKPCRTDWKIKHSCLTLMFIGNIVKCWKEFFAYFNALENIGWVTMGPNPFPIARSTVFIFSCVFTRYFCKDRYVSKETRESENYSLLAVSQLHA